MNLDTIFLPCYDNAMELVKTYGNLIKKYAMHHPVAARRMIETGLFLENFRASHLSDKRIPKAYVELNSFAVRSIRSGILHPEKTAWTNLFAPVEILQCFDLSCLSAEALSSFMSGFMIEDLFLSNAEAMGIAPTLCSYHKCFLGLENSGILPPARVAVTTSIACDANFNTFRLTESLSGVPTVFLDIPANLNENTIRYVEEQLKSLIETLTKVTGKTFDIDRLREILARENRSRALYKEFLQDKARRTYQTTLTLQMYGLFVTHLSIGSKEAEHFFSSLSREIKTMPEFHGKRIFWVHLLPFYQETLKDVFNLSDRYQIQGFDMNLDYMEELDTRDPIRALSIKLIRNLYNRPFEEKEEFVIRMAKALSADALIHFCHWGCKQSIGGVERIRSAAKKASLPILVIDGDGIDRKNSGNAQIKTRLEAFLEMIE